MFGFVCSSFKAFFMSFSTISMCFFSLVYLNARDRVQDQVGARLALVAWSVALPSQFGSVGIFSMHREYVLVVKEIRGGAYRPTSYLVAQTVPQLAMMLLLSAAALLPTLSSNLASCQKVSQNRGPTAPPAPEG